MQQYHLPHLPSWPFLLKHGRGDLAAAILHEGGFHAVAEHMHLPSASMVHARKPNGYWQEEGNLEREIRAFMAAHALATFPSVSILRTQGREDLCKAITQQGGWKCVAATLSIPYVVKGKPVIVPVRRVYHEQPPSDGVLRTY